MQKALEQTVQELFGSLRPCCLKCLRHFIRRFVTPLLPDSLVVHFLRAAAELVLHLRHFGCLRTVAFVHAARIHILKRRELVAGAFAHLRFDQVAERFVGTLAQGGGVLLHQLLLAAEYVGNDVVVTELAVFLRS